MDFNNLIEGDSIKVLHPFSYVDLRDYIEMSNRNLPVRVKWDFIKSLIVTKNGYTLWQIFERYLEVYYPNVIGMLYPPVDLINWIVEQSKLNKFVRR